MAQMTSEDCHELIAMWRQIAKDNAEAAARFNHLADQLQAALDAGKANFPEIAKKPVVLQRPSASARSQPDSD